MIYTLFLYNLFIIILFTVNATAFLFLYKKLGKVVYLWVCVMFVTYVFYDTLLYMADYIEGFARYYDRAIITQPILRTLICIVMYMAYGYIVIDCIKDKVRGVDKLAFSIYVLSMFIIPLLPLSEFNFFMYFTTGQLMFYYYLLRLYRGLNADIFSKRQLRQMKYFLLISFLINTMIIVEDVIVIFYYDMIEGLWVNINQRNFADDVLSVYISVVAFIYFVRSGYFDEEIKFITDSELEKQSFISNFDEFSKNCNLTQREKEIVLHIVHGKTNQEIADLLYITLGTVKNHTHNIYKKAGAAKRVQIIEMIQKIKTPQF